MTSRPPTVLDERDLDDWARELAGHHLRVETFAAAHLVAQRYVSDLTEMVIDAIRNQSGNVDVLHAKLATAKNIAEALGHLRDGVDPVRDLLERA